jgi:hypothetical protein
VRLIDINQLGATEWRRADLHPHLQPKPTRASVERSVLST